jgi:hypothetical protein
LLKPLFVQAIGHVVKPETTATKRRAHEHNTKAFEAKDRNDDRNGDDDVAGILIIMTACKINI